MEPGDLIATHAGAGTEAANHAQNIPQPTESCLSHHRATAPRQASTTSRPKPSTMARVSADIGPSPSVELRSSEGRSYDRCRIIVYGMGTAFWYNRGVTSGADLPPVVTDGRPSLIPRRGPRSVALPANHAQSQTSVPPTGEG